MKQLFWLLPTLFLITCQADTPIPEPPTAIRFIGSIIPNPLYNTEEDENRDPYIITQTNWPDSVQHNIGVHIEEQGLISFVSCEYVFATEQLEDMELWGEGNCEEHRVTPYEVYVASERIQFLLLEPRDLFWDCWDREELGSSGVVAGFVVWENRECVF